MKKGNLIKEIQNSSIHAFADITATGQWVGVILEISPENLSLGFRFLTVFLLSHGVIKNTLLTDEEISNCIEILE